MQVLGQQHDQLVAAVKQLTQERDAKTLELASKERIARMQVEAELTIGLAKINAADAQQKADYQWNQLEQIREHSHDVGMAAMQAAHTSANNAQQNAHAQNQQASQQDFQAQQAEQQQQMPEAA